MKFPMSMLCVSLILLPIRGAAFGGAGEPTSPDEVAEAGPGSARTASEPPAARVTPRDVRRSTDDDDWATVITRFAEAAVTGDAAITRDILAPNAEVRPLNSAKPTDLASLTGATRGGTVISARAYPRRPTALAADLAVDFGAASQVPEHARERMIPRDDDEMARANATAAEWLAQAVGSTAHVPVGVIVVWPDGAEPTDAQAAPIFILARGAETRPGDLRITHIAFGVPSPARR